MSDEVPIGPSGHPAPPIDARDIYPTCFELGTWFAQKLTDENPPRKIPRAPWAYPDHVDRYVGHNDESVWTDFETAREWTSKLPGFGVANRVPDVEAGASRPVFFDFDDVRNPETDEIHPEAWQFIQTHALPAWLSSSGTGLHGFALVEEIPVDYKAQAVIELGEWAHTETPELEIYAQRHFCALTGEHVAGTPIDSPDLTDLVGRMLRERGEKKRPEPEFDPDAEPEKTRAELADVATTGDMQDVFDALRHTGPRDIRLRSSVTDEHTDGSKSLDPNWANSKSGTRLAQVGDGWIYRKGMIGLDALQVVALEERIITHESEYPSGEDFWKAVDALRKRGAHIPEYEPAEAESEPVAVVPNPPNAPNALADQRGREWNWREGAERQRRDKTDTDGLTIDSARERTREAIGDAYQYGDQVLIEALPTLGKSFSAIAAAADTDEQISYLTNRGNNEQYQRAVERCERFGLLYAVLPSAWRDCPAFRGEYGEEIQKDVRRAYQNGATAKEIHIYAEEYFGYELPCQHDDETCEWQAKWGALEPEDADVLIGHYSHAHVMSATKKRTVVFDEFPGDTFETQLGGRLDQQDAPLAGPVSHFLGNTPALDIDDYGDLMAAREDEQRRADALGWFLSSEQPGRDPGLAFARDGDGHALAPLAAFTLLAGANNELGNGWERVGLHEVSEDGWIGLYNRAQSAVHLIRPPSESLRYASSIVALDGTPTREMWELSLGVRFNERQVLSNPERVEYLRDVLNHRYVRTTEHVKPYSSGAHVNPRDDAALLDRIRNEYGQKPALITSQNAKGVYHESDDIKFERGEGSGLTAESCVSEAKHYGDLLGSNDYKTERLGAVIGSRHFGDGYIKKWAAYAGEGAEREDDSEDGKGANLQYTGTGDAIHRHMTEHQTLQAAMRFGRDGLGAVVFVHTDTLPEWVPLAGEGRVIRTRKDGERQLLDALNETEWSRWRTAELAEHPSVEISERQVRTHLHRLVEDGYLDASIENGGYVWRDTGLHRISDTGEVELDAIDLAESSDEETAEVDGSSSFTWNFRNSGFDTSPERMKANPSVRTPPEQGSTAPDPPPDDGR